MVRPASFPQGFLLMELVGDLSLVGDQFIVSLEFGNGGVERLCHRLEEAFEMRVSDLGVVKVLQQLCCPRLELGVEVNKAH